MPNSIATIMGLTPVSGDVGIEIEMECENLPPSRAPSGWRSESDGSLRGNGVEFVMAHPVGVGSVPDYLRALRNKLESANSRPYYTYRAGVHVHVNVQDLTVEQVIRFALTYYVLEDALTRYCGGSREGNHHCLRIRDAAYPLQIIEGMQRAEQIHNFHTDAVRYAALNFLSLFRYGSLEFRAMETQPDLSKIDEWANILCRIKQYALTIENRQQIAYDLSFHGPEGFLREVVGDTYAPLLLHDNFEEETMDSMRHAQLAIYGEEITQ